MSKKIIVGIIIAIVAIAVVVGAYYVFDIKPDKASQKTTTSTKPSSSDTTTTTPSQQNETAIITYSNEGFSPSTITVNTGDKITIINSSSRDLEFESGPHPTHTQNSELNVGELKPGEQKTITVTQKGTFDVHNHLNPNDSIEIVIQ